VSSRQRIGTYEGTFSWNNSIIRKSDGCGRSRRRLAELVTHERAARISAPVGRQHVLGRRSSTCQPRALILQGCALVHQRRFLRAAEPAGGPALGHRATVFWDNSDPPAGGSADDFVRFDRALKPGTKSIRGGRMRVLWKSLDHRRAKHKPPKPKLQISSKSQNTKSATGQTRRRSVLEPGASLKFIVWELEFYEFYALALHCSRIEMRFHF